VVGPILFVFFLNFFAVSLVVSSLRQGKPAIVSTMLERSKGVSITREDNPIWYWVITGNYIFSAVGLALQSFSMILPALR
jgi:hypothetical protein